MKKENWKEIKTTLRAALEIEPARRQFFLNRAAPDSEIRREVESLLAYETATEDFMSMPLGDYSKDFLSSEGGSDSETEISFVNQKIGAYEILQELGGGGMGTVYLGKRADGKFEQRVAIKLLRREFNNDKFRRHFEREKEIQARLNHPNIARLIDAGTTSDGIPFLVMEYVEGAPVDRYCRTKNLSLKERLKLFNRICEAVAAAHRSLIVHRDLKPSNILIDDAGEPKLLDFGISKVLNHESADEKQTVTLLGAMTPEYASPEQIKGDPITTATDIYSLGVILFKILAGDFPYDFKNKTNGKLLREITDSEPVLVSAAAAKSDYEEKIPASKLKGDLDNIILKSLRKKPTERYQSVEQFAADLWRYIDGLPVRARPATFAYRTNKFIKRHRISVIAAAFVFLSLIGGIAVASWQARTANAAQRQAENQSLFARQEEEKAKKISDFMSKIIAYASPHWLAPGYKYRGEAKVIEALKELDEQIETEFSGQPDVQADLHLKFAEAYHFRGEEELFARKRFHIDRALELRKSIYGEYHEKVAQVLYLKWASLPTDDPRQAEILMEAITMMRGTNPNNLNLPYMSQDYAGRLISMDEIKFGEGSSILVERNVRVPSNEELRRMYRKAVLPPPSNENNYEIAEKILRDAMPIFRLYYKQDNYATAWNECLLSYALAKQHKWMDFDEHFRVCRLRETQTLGDHLKTYRKTVEAIEKNSVGNVF